jgi:DNA repair protein RadA/Sms
MKNEESIKLTKQGKPSTRGIEIPKNHEKMSRSEFIQHTIMLGFEPEHVEQLCLIREPKAKKDEVVLRIIQEAIRKQRHLYLQALSKNSILDKDTAAITLDKIKPKPVDFLKTSIERLNWVFDGGLAKGHLIVLAGDPGVGKTRTAISIASGLTHMGMIVHYFQSEVTPERFAAWANQQNPVKPNFLVDSSTTIEKLTEKVIETKPALVIVDSVDMFKRSFSSSEARRTVVILKHAAEISNCPFLLIHHLNKQGGIKGSNDIEYLADVCAYARNHSLSFVVKEFSVEIPTKNRCGIAGRMAMFRHTETGVEPVETSTQQSGLKLVANG